MRGWSRHEQAAPTHSAGLQLNSSPLPFLGLAARQHNGIVPSPRGLVPDAAEGSTARRLGFHSSCAVAADESAQRAYPALDLRYKQCTGRRYRSAPRPASASQKVKPANNRSSCVILGTGLDVSNLSPCSYNRVISNVHT